MGKDFFIAPVMSRMRNEISQEVEEIRRSLSSHPSIDYHARVAEFVAPYSLKVGNETIRAEMIFLCTGSKPFVPPIKGLESVGYQTSDTVLRRPTMNRQWFIIMRWRSKR